MNRCHKCAFIRDYFRYDFLLLNVFRNQKNQIFRRTESDRPLVFCILYRKALHRLSGEENSLIGKVGKCPVIEFGCILEILILTCKGIG